MEAEAAVYEPQRAENRTPTSNRQKKQRLNEGGRPRRKIFHFSYQQLREKTQ